MHTLPQFESVSLKISPPRKRIKDTDSLAKIKPNLTNNLKNMPLKNSLEKDSQCY
jgi:hypothetical protein